MPGLLPRDSCQRELANLVGKPVADAKHVATMTCDQDPRSSPTYANMPTHHTRRGTTPGWGTGDRGEQRTSEHLKIMLCNGLRLTIRKQSLDNREVPRFSEGAVRGCWSGIGARLALGQSLGGGVVLAGRWGGAVGSAQASYCWRVILQGRKVCQFAGSCPPAWAQAVK